MSDLWALCEPCGRWFYPENDAGGDRPPACPVCSTEATTLAEQPDDDVPEQSAPA